MVSMVDFATWGRRAPRRTAAPVRIGVLALLLTACGDDGMPVGDDGGAQTGASSGPGTGADGTVPTTGADADATQGMPGSTDGPAPTGDGPDTGNPDGTAEDDATGSPTGSSDDGGRLGAVAECFEGQFVNQTAGLGPDYDQFDPIPGSHCSGTNHQDIAGVTRAVFLGDSVTVGTPPWESSVYYRSIVADALEAQFGLQFGQGFLQDEATWKGINILEGQAGAIRSGDFAACAEWGARTDDFTPTQLPQCFEAADFAETTLVVITMGGNDIANLTKDAIDGATMEEMWATAEDVVQLKRDAIEWLTEDGRFPNGVYVVFGNIYEFTDGTGEVESCDVSGLAGFDEPVPAPEQLKEIVVWIQEQYMDIAVSTGTDMIFMFEAFCGHGFNSTNPAAPCYRGPGNAEWFDFTCTHPNDVGHAALAQLFIDTIAE